MAERWRPGHKAVRPASRPLRIAGDDCEVVHESVEEVREATVADGHEPGLRNAGDWPFEE